MRCPTCGRRPARPPLSERLRIDAKSGPSWQAEDLLRAADAIDLLRRYAEHHEAHKAENGTIDAEVDTFLRDAGVPL